MSESYEQRKARMLADRLRFFGLLMICIGALVQTLILWAMHASDAPDWIFIPASLAALLVVVKGAATLRAGYRRADHD